MRVLRGLLGWQSSCSAALGIGPTGNAVGSSSLGVSSLPSVSRQFPVPAFANPEPSMLVSSAAETVPVVAVALPAPSFTALPGKVRSRIWDNAMNILCYILIT